VTLHMLRASHALLLRGATTVMSYVVACVSEPRTCGGMRLGAQGTEALMRDIARLLLPTRGVAVFLQPRYVQTARVRQVLVQSASPSVGNEG
jgi:hypothetical protein